ncbi:MAG: ATP-binding protein [Acetobacteraceae bacterium]
MAITSGLFDAAVLTPHGFCLSWEPGLMALHVVSDAVIAGSYYSIPLAIAVLLLRRGDIVFGWMGWLFALFILACGTTHAMGIWTLWHPDYLADGLVKVVTALASVMTAAALWPLLPRLVALPSPHVLLQANERLTQQIAERDAAVAALRRETIERERAEEMLRQSQKMEAVGQLTGGVAHDFNNLLQVIQANLEALALRIGGDDPLRRHIDRAMSGTEKGATLTQQLLAFARRQALQPVSFDVTERIASLSEMLRGMLGGEISVVTRWGDDLWPAEADPHQLDTAVLNLAINARDAMPGGGRLTIAVDNAVIDASTAAGLPDVEAGDYVRVTVADTGIGMTREIRDAAFEPFFTTKAVGQGSGLGLSQVYGFVKQSRGHITLESAPGEGTTVALYLRRGSAPAVPLVSAVRSAG